MTKKMSTKEAMNVAPETAEPMANETNEEMNNAQQPQQIEFTPENSLNIVVNSIDAAMKEGVYGLGDANIILEALKVVRTEMGL